MSGIPFGTTDWSRIERAEHKGARGVAYWRTQHFGTIRVRKAVKSKIRREVAAHPQTRNSFKALQPYDANLSRTVLREV
jgi:hypothetical protein